MLRAAIIGFGGIAHGAHLPGYAELEATGKVKLVAVCDIDPAQFDKEIDLNIGGEKVDFGADLHRYTDWREMIETEAPDLVDICLPTFLHAAAAIDALNLGCHVLSEKPMSLNFADCQRMCDAAKASGKYLMVAQCLRFSGDYEFLKQSIENNTFGKPLAGTFHRLSSNPRWAWDNWFNDEARSGGCLLDMHIHDIDMARYLFGEPRRVNCFTQNVYSGRDIVHTQLHYDGFSVLAEGDWSLHGMGFDAGYRVSFEKATVVLEKGTLTVYPRDSEPYQPQVDSRSMYTNEIEFLLDAIETGAENRKNPPESAAQSVRLVEILRASADQGGALLPFEA